MKTRMLWAPVLLALGSAACAQDAADASDTPLLDYVVESCQADLDKYCSQVTPGEGRMLYCVAAHQDKISDKCEGALVDAAMILADVTDRVVAVAEACGPELNKFCANVEIGEGRVLTCLSEHDKELSDTCEVAVDDLVEEE